MTSSEPIEFMGWADWNFDPAEWKPNQVWLKKNPETMQEFSFINGQWTAITDKAPKMAYGFFPENMDKEIERYRLELAQARARINTLEKYIIDKLLKEQS